MHGVNPRGRSPPYVQKMRGCRVGRATNGSAHAVHRLINGGVPYVPGSESAASVWFVPFAKFAARSRSAARTPSSITG